MSEQHATSVRGALSEQRTVTTMSHGMVLAMLALFGLCTASTLQGAENPRPVASRHLDRPTVDLPSAQLSDGLYFNDPEILGGQLEVVRIDGALRYAWDGPDDAADRVERTGLGGLDLSDGGLRDRFILQLSEVSRGSSLRVLVYDTAGGEATAELRMRGAGRLELPFADLDGSVDLTHTGAVAIELQGEGRLLALALGSSFHQQRSRSLALDRNSNGYPNVGDLIEQRLVWYNAGSQPSAPLNLRQGPSSSRRQLVPGTAVASRGTLIAGNGANDRSLVLRAEPLPPGGEVEIRWRERVVRGPIREVTVVLQDGDTPAGGGGNAVTSLNIPFTNGDGEVGFTGQVDNGGSSDGFVWFDSGITLLNSSSVAPVLNGVEGYMGVGDNGEFIYSPSVDGSDAVWTDLGELLREDIQAPGFPAGTNNTFNSRPTMTAAGAAFWVSGFNETGGTSSEGRMLYSSPDRMPGSIAVVLRSDDLVGGVAIDRPSGIGFDYNVSDDSSHTIAELLLDTGSTANDGIMYVDGSNIGQEGSPSGDGDNWDNFDTMSINNAGDHLFSGDTDGATTSDEFVAYNGSIVVREGDTLDGVNLTTSASVRGVSINNLGQAVHAWGVDGGTEHVFHACDASDLPGTSTLVFSTGDSVDVDGDGISDGTVTDLNSFGSTLFLAEDGRLFLEVDIDLGGGEQEAIISLTLPTCGAAQLKINEVDYDQDSVDTEEFIEIYNAGSTSVDLSGFALELVNGTGGGASVYNTISLPAVSLAAGDFFVVCGDPANVPNCDLDASPDSNLVQNGAPDAVALIEVAPPGIEGPVSPTIIDTVSYEGDSGAPYTEGSGAGLEDDPGIDFFSISRIVDGDDTDQNNVDFAGRCNSPGLPNFDTTSGCTMVPVELMSFSVE